MNVRGANFTHLTQQVALDSRSRASFCGGELLLLSHALKA